MTLKAVPAPIITAFHATTPAREAEARHELWLFSWCCSAHQHLAGHAPTGCGVVPAGKVVEGWFPLLTRRKTHKGEVRMRLQLTTVEQLPMYCQGVGPGGCHGAVHQAYFPLRRGCRITLYQNASVTTDEEVRSPATWLLTPAYSPRQQAASNRSATSEEAATGAPAQTTWYHMYESAQGFMAWLLSIRRVRTRR